MNKILQGDCLEILKTLEAGSVQTCVTSPPYYGLRDYGASGQIGLEETPEAYVDKLVQVFREVRRVLKDDGTLWLNLGDSYAGSGVNDGTKNPGISKAAARGDVAKRPNVKPTGLKPKDLIGIPWMVAFALRADGWYLRSDIIWYKRNPMPESVTDRPTKSHEYIFLLSNSAQYYYDHEAILEPITQSSVLRLAQDIEGQKGSSRANGGAKSNGNMKAVIREKLETGQTGQAHSGYENPDGSLRVSLINGVPARNKRDVWAIDEDEFMQFLQWKAEQAQNKLDVWDVTTKPYKEAHFATFPPDLIEPCILAGSREGDTVLDPFNGSGTTGAVSIKHHRNYIGCELNPAYIELTEKRLQGVQPVLFRASQ